MRRPRARSQAWPRTCPSSARSGCSRSPASARPSPGRSPRSARPGPSPSSRGCGRRSRTGCSSDQDPGARAEARPAAAPRTPRQLARRAARRDQGGTAGGPAGLRQQERGEAAARHRAAGRRRRPGPAQRGRRDRGPRRRGDRRGSRGASGALRRPAAPVRRDHRRRRRPGARRLGPADGRAHRHARGRFGDRLRAHQDLDPHGRGLQIDLRVVPLDSWGAALQYFTGSQAHNVAIREMAVRRSSSCPNTACSTP